MRAALTSVALLLFCSAAAHAVTYRVNPAGSGDFPTIQAALDAAASGDTVALEIGIYTGNGNHNLSFHGRAIIFRSRSGNPSSCSIDMQGHDNTGIVLFDREGPGTVIEGITIRGGVTGILCGDYSSPTIENCIIRENRTDTEGGGICVLHYSYPTVRGCQFINNYAGSDGGGIGFLDVIGGPAAATVSNCYFQGNEAGFHGGGASFTGDQWSSFTDCIFVGNRAYSGGAFFACAHGGGMTRCTFIDNQARWGGSGTI